MKRFGLNFLSITFALCTSTQALAVVAANTNTLTYQGRIVKSSGAPLEHSSVSFIFQVADPTGQCVIYQEQVSGINMTNSNGVFDTSIGTGTISWPTSGSFSVIDTFNNSSTFPCGSCTGYSCSAGSSNYTPLASDGRILKVQFHDGIGWKYISPDTVIRSVPFAGYAAAAQKLGPYRASDFILRSSIPATCTSTQVLTVNTSGQIVCAEDAGGATGTVTSVAGSGPITVTGTTSVTISANVGTGANQLAAGNDARFSDARTPSGSAGGDLTGTYPDPQIANGAITTVKINTGAVTTAKLANGIVTPLKLSLGTADGQVHRFDGTNWAITKLNYQDLVNDLGTSPFPTLSCAANEFLTWSAATESFVCEGFSGGGGTVTSVASGTGLTGGPITGTGTLSIANGGVGTTQLADGAVTGAKLETLSGLTASSYGSATSVPVLSIDTKGRVTAISTTTITGLPSGTSGQFLKSNGTTWASANILFSDIKNSSGLTAFNTSACGANETVKWSALTDMFECQPIGSLSASAITGGTLDAARIPASIRVDEICDRAGGNCKSVTSGWDAGTASGIGVLDSGTISGSAVLTKTFNFPQDYVVIFSSYFGGANYPYISLSYDGTTCGADRSYIASGANHGSTTCSQVFTAGSHTIRSEYAETSGTTSNMTSHSMNYVVFAKAAAVASQWLSSGSNISYTTGNIGIGTTNPIAKIQALSASSKELARFTYISSSVDEAALRLQKARGTASTPTIVNSGDSLGGVVGQGFDGTNYVNAGAILVESDGTPGTNDMPGRLTFLTTPDGNSVAVERMRITNTGNVGIGTTSPTAKLEVAGTPGVDGIKFPDGTLQTSAAASSSSLGVGQAWTNVGASRACGTSYTNSTGKPIQVIVSVPTSGGGGISATVGGVTFIIMSGYSGSTNMTGSVIIPAATTYSIGCSSFSQWTELR